MGLRFIPRVETRGYDVDRPGTFRLASLVKGVLIMTSPIFQGFSIWKGFSSWRNITFSPMDHSLPGLGLLDARVSCLFNKEIVAIFCHI